MKKTLLMLLLLVNSLTTLSQTITYTENSSIISNPERGLQKYSSTSSDGVVNLLPTFTYNPLSQTTLTNWRTGTDKVTVVYRYFILPSVDLNTTYLTNMQTDFNRIRNAGLKTIIRFAYTNDCNTGCDTGTNPQQPTKAQILGHISQLSNVINTNKDVILSIQCGFIGTWGEWYYTGSSEFGHKGTVSSTQWQNRKQVVDSMLSNFHIDIPLQVRYANAKRQMYGSAIPTNFGQDRIGFYNDAFLNTYGDMGTYNVSSKLTNPIGTSDYNFIANTSKYLPMTGETNGLNAPRTDVVNAINEMNQLNFSVLNRDYFTQNWNNWIASGKYNEIVNNLGYRLVLVSSTLSGNELSLQVVNNGYSKVLFNKNTYLVLRNANGDIKRLTNIDIRTLNKGLNNVSVTIPSDIPDGSYSILLHIADKNLENKPEYSIQFANNNIFESTTGYNNLNQTYTKGTPIDIFQSVVIFPNPFINQINISGITGYTVKIRNSRNRNVAFTLVNNVITLNVNRGTYYLTITKSGQSRTYTIIKN